MNAALTVSKLLCFTLFASCSVPKHPDPSDTAVHRSIEYQAEIDALLLLDRANKEYEEQVLHEINVAIEHQDPEAYRFFLQEYINIPRLIIPEWLQHEDNFYPGLSPSQKKLRLHIIREQQR